MVAFRSLVVSLLVAAPTWALPLVSRSKIPELKFPPVVSGNVFCNVPIPIIQAVLCPRDTSASSASTTTSVSTPLGTAEGAADTSGVTRFAVRYGSADRWQPSSVVTAWEFPAGASNASGLPLACPQSDMDSSQYSEDCLAMLLYVPPSVMSGSGAPTLVWIHGGSFDSGSATAAGLDGSNLALNTGSIVAVIQYRLGALGLMAPSGETNLAVKDVMTAMEFLQQVVPSFGGDATMITLDGQSSGANMIRALLAVPSAADLFQSGILQSDPMDYGFLNTTMQDTLQTFYNAQLPCSSSDTSCLNALSVDTILSAQDNLIGNASYLCPASGSEPMRPVRDGVLITSPLDSTAPFPAVSKPLLLTTVLDEAMLTIYGEFPDPIGTAVYVEVVDDAFGQPRAGRLLSTSEYIVEASSTADVTTDARPQLQTMGTDQVWRCATWTFARNWVSNGGTVYVGLYVVGATYPGNSAVPECLDSGSVCHQDDIEIVFGTVPSPTGAQSALINEMQARYSAFLRTGNPNTGSYPNWTAATGSTIDALQLGGSGNYPAGTCTPTYWGDYVEYDYQVYDI
ncbi:alpha/beta-hydrolase [Wolfiporia cocos MD-104 SS10]|uniref:Carboxylic ester hydrolase n=1 Tax=Wolfiporia cocos (strain MD-104) TaxID=742152 RepID=A0A2H3JIZ7_WOLCO|nr:alpha/beta-hydrolase [Wolfiporia cocos MD-104 SS10]